MRQEEIKGLKADIAKLQKALTMMDIIESTISETASEMEGITSKTMAGGIQESAYDLEDSLARTKNRYAESIEYFQKRVALLQKLDRQDKYKNLQAVETRKKLAEVVAKRMKAKPIKVTFQETKSEHQFKVFVGDTYVGQIRRSRIRYQSDTVLDFTKEAKETRTFVTAEGKLNIEAIAKYSNSRFRKWKYGRCEEFFDTHEEAARAMIASKMPEVKITF